MQSVYCIIWRSLCLQHRLYTICFLNNASFSMEIEIAKQSRLRAVGFQFYNNSHYEANKQYNILSTQSHKLDGFVFICLGSTKGRTTYWAMNGSNRAKLDLDCSRSSHVPQPGGMAGGDSHTLVYSHFSYQFYFTQQWTVLPFFFLSQSVYLLHIHSRDSNSRDVDQAIRWSAIKKSQIHYVRK